MRRLRTIKPGRTGPAPLAVAKVTTRLGALVAAAAPLATLTEGMSSAAGCTVLKLTQLIVVRAPGQTLEITFMSQD